MKRILLAAAAVMLGASAQAAELPSVYTGLWCSEGKHSWVVARRDWRGCLPFNRVRIEAHKIIWHEDECELIDTAEGNMRAGGLHASYRCRQDESQPWRKNFYWFIKRGDRLFIY